MKDKERILIVDDDLDFLKIIKMILENKGYAVDTAPSAAECISRIKERFYHATILDISLPDAHGTDLLSHVLEIHPDIIAIMLTGHSSVDNAVQSLNRGAFAYLEKPLDTENLLSVISRGLEKQRLVMENRNLMEELEQRNRITNTLLNVSQAVSESLDLQNIIDSSLDKVAVYTGIDISFIYLFENDRLILKGSHGLKPKETSLLASEIPRDGSIISRIFKQAKAITITNFSDTSDVCFSFLKTTGCRAFAGIPLSILSESIGVMGIATKSDNTDVIDDNMELLNGIAREISIAVRNAQLYEAASSAKALKELDNMRTEFLANVSHELEAEALEVKRKKCRLKDVIESVKDRLDNLAVRHQLELSIPGDLPQVNIDDIRIGQVLTNLVENAVKFSEDNTIIYIKADRNGDEIIISVEDEGSGIAPEHHEKIFERFFQGNGRKTGRRKGTGLGLAICRGIVEAHQGKIWVDSQVNKGTRFNFSLPVG
jgi:K+-sensing histidine kinase KdpD